MIDLVQQTVDHWVAQFTFCPVNTHNTDLLHKETHRQTHYILELFSYWRLQLYVPYPNWQSLILRSTKCFKIDSLAQPYEGKNI